MFKVLKAILLFFLISNPILAQNNASVSTGNEKLQKKDYKEALNNFSQALNTNPSDIQVLCGIALAHNGLGNIKEASEFIETALKLNPQSDLVNNTKGEILLSAKDYTGAINLFNKTLGINKLYLQAYIGKSKAYNLLGDSKEAFKVLDDAIQAFPTNAELLLARGLLNNNKEKYSKALNDFDKALQLNPLNAFVVYFNRGLAFSNLQEYESALSDFNEAATLDSTNANAFYSRGLANYQLGNYEISVKDFLRSDELNPNNSVTYYNLGMSYYKLEDVENACIYFHKSCGMKNTNACKMIIMSCSDKQKR